MYTVPKLEDFSATALKTAFERLQSDFEKSVGQLIQALDQLKNMDTESAAKEAEEKRKKFRNIWQAQTNGVLTQIRNLWLKTAPPDLKREVGSLFNGFKIHVDSTIDKMQAYARDAVMWQGAVIGVSEELHKASAFTKLESQRLDVTLPGA